jgi:DNA-binding CsgD family transcriptional regulator
VRQPLPASTGSPGSLLRSRQLLRQATEEARDGVSLRRRVIAALDAAGIGPYAFTYGLVPQGDGAAMVDWEASRERGPDDVSALAAFAADPDGRYIEGLLELGAAGQRVERLGQQRGYPLLGRGLRDALQASGIGDYVRRIVWDDQELVGVVAVGATPGDRPLPEDAPVAFQGLADEVAGALALAGRLDRHLEGPADLVCDAEGAVVFASGSGLAWLGLPGARERLRRQVVAFVAHPRNRPVGLGRTVPLMQRLHGDRGQPDHVLVHLTPSPNARRTALHALTPRQREVATYAAAGATAPEIARAMGISPHTVRVHLRAVYAQLGIGSRAELATLLHAPGSPG